MKTVFCLNYINFQRENVAVSTLISWENQRIRKSSWKRCNLIFQKNSRQIAPCKDDKADAVELWRIFFTQYFLWFYYGKNVGNKLFHFFTWYWQWQRWRVLAEFDWSATDNFKSDLPCEIVVFFRFLSPSCRLHRIFFLSKCWKHTLAFAAGFLSIFRLSNQLFNLAGLLGKL